MKKINNKKSPSFPIFCPKCKNAVLKNDEIFIFDKGHCFNCELDEEYQKQIKEENKKHGKALQN